MDKNLAERASLLLEPSEEQKERMRRNILEKYQEGRSRRKRRGRFRPALAAAAAVCLILTTTAVAAEYLGLDIGFLEFLRPSDDGQEEYLAQGAYSVNQTISRESGEVTVKQVIGDSNLVYVLLDFTAPEGTELDMARYQFEDCDFDAGQGFSSAKFQMAEEPDGGNRVSLVLSVMTREALAGRAVHLRLGNLQAAGAYPDAFETVAEGEWEFSFPLDFQQYSNARTVDLQADLFGYPAEIRSVSVSPIAVTLKVKSSFAREISQKRRAFGSEVGPDRHVDNYPLILHYQDGTIETTELFDGLYEADYQTGEITLIKTFENVIQDKEIEFVEFFGVQIPIFQK